MSDHSDFKARIQFSFKGGTEKYTDRSSQVHAKVEEIFRSKDRIGCLKHWLMQLAYEAAEKELELEQSEAFVVKPSLKKESSPIVEEGVSRFEAQQGVGQCDSGAEAEKVIGKGMSEPEDTASHRSTTVIDEGSVNDDLSAFMPLTLSNPSEPRKESLMRPKGLGNLVMNTST